MSYSPGSLIAVPALAEILIGVDHHHYVWMIMRFSDQHVMITNLRC